LKALSFKKTRQNIILSVNVINIFKNKRSSIKLTFSKWKISTVPLINGSTDNGLINGQRKLCPALSNSLRTAQIYCNMSGRVRGWRWKEPTPHAPLHYQVLYLISWAFYSLTGWNCLYEMIDGLHGGLAASRSLSRQVQTIPAGPQHVAFHHNPGGIQTCKKKVFKKCYRSVKSGPRQQSRR
jgi:hypothetical protein